MAEISTFTDLEGVTYSFRDDEGRKLDKLTGTLAVGHGGTGQTSAQKAAEAFINALQVGSNPPVDGDYFISQFVGGNGENAGSTGADRYYRRPVSALWSYVRGKIAEVLGLSESGYTGRAARAGDAETVGGHSVRSDVPENAVFSDTTYPEASASAAGLLSAADKRKLDGIALSEQAVWEQGGISATGNPAASQTRIRLVRPLRCPVGTTVSADEGYSFGAHLYTAQEYSAAKRIERRAMGAGDWTSAHPGYLGIVFGRTDGTAVTEADAAHLHFSRTPGDRIACLEARVEASPEIRRATLPVTGWTAAAYGCWRDLSFPGASFTAADIVAVGLDAQSDEDLAALDEAWGCVLRATPETGTTTIRFKFSRAPTIELPLRAAVW